MQGRLAANARIQRGFTLVELSISAGLLVLLLGSITSSFWVVSAAFDEEVSEADLVFRARSGMDQLVRIASNTVTSDAAYELLPAGGGPDRWGLRHRELLEVKNGIPDYEDFLVVHLIGPNTGAAPCEGVVVGLGPDLAAIHGAGAGPDGLLGTVDDDVTAEFVAGTPVVRLLIPSTFAPQSGEMLSITDTTSASGRLLTITLRTNLLRPDGTFLRTQDLVLTERVALRF